MIQMIPRNLLPLLFLASICPLMSSGILLIKSLCHVGLTQFDLSAAAAGTDRAG